MIMAKNVTARLPRMAKDLSCSSGIELAGNRDLLEGTAAGREAFLAEIGEALEAVTEIGRL